MLNNDKRDTTGVNLACPVPIVNTTFVVDEGYLL